MCVEKCLMAFMLICHVQRIGKVLWTVKSPEVNGRIWEYDQIIDIVMREYGTMPKFTNM